MIFFLEAQDYTGGMTTSSPGF